MLASEEPIEFQSTSAKRAHARSRALAILIFAGPRPNEALALIWSDIDWQHGLIRVRRNATRFGVGRPKTESSNRDVPMIPLVGEGLAKQRERSEAGGELVFPTENGEVFDLSKLQTSQLAAHPASSACTVACAVPVPAHVRADAFGARRESAVDPTRARSFEHPVGLLSLWALACGDQFREPRTLGLGRRSLCPPSAQSYGNEREGSGRSRE